MDKLYTINKFQIGKYKIIKGGSKRMKGGEPKCIDTELLKDEENFNKKQLGKGAFGEVFIYVPINDTSNKLLTCDNGYINRKYYIR